MDLSLNDRINLLFSFLYNNDNEDLYEVGQINVSDISEKEMKVSLTNVDRDEILNEVLNNENYSLFCSSEKNEYVHLKKYNTIYSCKDTSPKSYLLIFVLFSSAISDILF